MTPGVVDIALRDLSEEAAIVTDRYIDALLAAADRRATDAPTDSSLHPALRATARRLNRELVRVHPSFRFEERLAAALGAAGRDRLAVAAGAEGVIVFPRLGDGPEWDAFDPLADPPGSEPDWQAARRPLLIGGAVASAALSVAGAAIVAWRLTRGEGDPMVWAVRAVNRLRADAHRTRPA